MEMKPFNGELACGLNDVMVFLFKSNNSAAHAFRYVQGVVCTFHVANHNLVKTTGCIYHLHQMAFGVVSIYNNRYFLFIIHVANVIDYCLQTTRRIRIYLDSDDAPVYRIPLKRSFLAAFRLRGVCLSKVGCGIYGLSNCRPRHRCSRPPCPVRRCLLRTLFGSFLR